MKSLEERQVKAELFRVKKKEEMAQKSKNLSEKVMEEKMQSILNKLNYHHITMYIILHVLCAAVQYTNQYTHCIMYMYFMCGNWQKS